MLIVSRLASHRIYTAFMAYMRCKRLRADGISLRSGSKPRVCWHIEAPHSPSSGIMGVIEQDLLEKPQASWAVSLQVSALCCCLHLHSHHEKWHTALCCSIMKQTYCVKNMPSLSDTAFRVIEILYTVLSMRSKGNQEYVSHANVRGACSSPQACKHAGRELF